MIERLAIIFQILKTNVSKLLLVSTLLAIVYYLILLLSLIVRFGDLPNYIKFYDWWGHVKTIVASTPSFKDTFLIIKDEWLLEIGFMNFDFGAGISEWSLFFAPFKILGVFILAFFLVLNYLLIKEAKKTCSPQFVRSAGATTGIGAVFVSLASVTMSWVVCCSYPTWVVGLAMMGLGVSTSLWLEPLGFTVNFIGFFILVISTMIAAGGAKSLRTAS